MITLIKKEKIIIHTKQEQNWFVFESTAARAVIAIRNLKFKKVIAIIGYKQPTKFLNQNEYIRV